MRTRTVITAVVKHKTLKMGYCKNAFSSILIVMITLRGIETEFVTTGSQCTVANAVCTTTCECKEGFTKLNEFCLGKIGTKCSMTPDCIPDAICVNFSGSTYCACPDGLKAELNNKECRLKVGSPCNVTGATYCIHNAVCDVTSGTGKGKHLRVQIGFPCSTISECIQHTECTGNKCTCEALFTPSADKTKCIGYVDAPCHTNSTSCVANAECIQGQCQCKQGYLGDKMCNKAEIKEQYSDWILFFAGWAGWVVVVLIVISCVMYYCCCTRCRKRCRKLEKQPSKK